MTRRSPKIAMLCGFALAAASVLGLGSLAPNTAVADQTAPTTVTCEEKIPKGAKRPKTQEKFPGEAVAGFEARLELEIRHGKGETPLPNGFKVPGGSSTARFLEESGFLVAEPDGGRGAEVESHDDGNATVTKVKIPFVVAPIKSGNHSLTLPQIPIAVSRANGDTMTICTQLHLLTVLDPTAGEEDPKPRSNPDGRQQIEDWPFMKMLLAGLLLLLVIAAVVAWWVRRQLKKPVPLPVPVRSLPWEEALGELQLLATSPLLDERPEAGRERTEHFDKVSDTLRKYLGARYGFEGLGFDGLETTTHEMLGLLKRVRPAVPSLDLIQAFLTECDLVKFARVVPDMSDCKLAIERAETVVRATMPIATGQAPSTPAQPTIGEAAVMNAAATPPATPSNPTTPNLDAPTLLSRTDSAQEPQAPSPPPTFRIPGKHSPPSSGSPPEEPRS